MLEKLYNNFILKYPKIILTTIVIFTIIMAKFALDLKIDASADSLLLKGDRDLAFTRKVSQTFTAPEFLIVTYSSKESILTDKNIKNIIELSNILKKNITKIDSITNITNVPLLQSPPRDLAELTKKVPTLLDKDIDKTLVAKEFTNSPLYKQNLVSDDLKTTAILLNLKPDNPNIPKEILKEQNHKNIVKIRAIVKRFMDNHPTVKLHLGGTPMIADDMVEFVKYDLKTFGVAIVALLFIILYLIFKEIKWMLLPLFICTVSIVVTSGFLAIFDWQITVVSSNFISLQLIMNMSLVVHLIVKYQELLESELNLSQKELLIKTISTMATPSFFVVITTIAGFSSLVFSNILPIINFGWMMSFGIVISLIVTFLLFPLTLIFAKKKELEISTLKNTTPLTAKLPHIVYKYKNSILIVSLLVAIFSITGAYKLKVENSFIDYFKKTTEIYQGMKLIDQKLGGTTPLDVIVTFKENSSEVKDIKVTEASVDEELDDFDDEFNETEDEKQNYWFTRTKMELVKNIHQYLEKQDGIGKVLSLNTIDELGKILNNGEELDGLTLALLYKKLPAKYKNIILSPYVNIEKNQVRISTRVIDSKKGLNRNLLIKKIKKDLNKIVDKTYATYNVTNLLVIYDNLLQSLYNSQIKTIGLTIFLLWIMFLIIFKNFMISVIAMIANIVPVGVIFGFMGYNGIPLDMMTITIAAISMGIAVDDTIHYLHRFNYEMKLHSNIKESIINSHKSIGRAMFYTSTIIIVGFSLLVLSNFIPTIYFGLLTVMAMFMAILADLLLLPTLLLVYNNLKRGKNG